MDGSIKLYGGLALDGFGQGFRKAMSYIKTPFLAIEDKLISVNYKKVFSPRTIVLCLVSFLLTIFAIVCIVVSNSLRDTLLSQQAAMRFSGQSGDRYSQVSVFFPASSETKKTDILQLKEDIEKALFEAAIVDDAEDRFYADAWFGEGIVSVAGPRGAAQANAIAVGGDYFLFHQLKLRDGSYISPDDVMRDRVVVDEELAWRLFGATGVAGFDILINNQPFQIAGVIVRESDFASSLAYGDGAGLFMSFEALDMLLRVQDENSEAIVLGYEIVLPDPIVGFGYSIMVEAVSDDSAVVVENTSRFSVSNIVGVLQSFGNRSMQTDSIVFPHWENAARVIEDWLALLLVLTILFFAFPLVMVVICIVKILRYLFRKGKMAFRGLVEKRDEREYEKYLLAQNKALSK